MVVDVKKSLLKTVIVYLFINFLKKKKCASTSKQKTVKMNITAVSLCELYCEHELCPLSNPVQNAVHSLQPTETKRCFLLTEIEYSDEVTWPYALLKSINIKITPQF